MINKSVKRFLVLALIVLVPLLVACSGSDSVSASDIAGEIKCQCGCTEVLNTCDCDYANEWNALIKQKLAQGQSKEQILQYFVDEYGLPVLVNP